MPDGLSNSLQENVLLLACFYPEHAPIVRNVVPLKLFEGPYREIAKRAFEYLDEFGTAPGDHLFDLFDDITDGEDRRKGKAFADLLIRLFDVREGINTDFILARVQDFVTQQRLKEITLEAMETLQGGADNVVSRTLDILARADGVNNTDLFDPGIRLSDVERGLAFLDQLEDAFPTGIRAFDRISLGPRRKTLHLFIGLPNRGKSWWLVNLGRRALQQRLNVVHVTLEMSADQVAQRYFQAIFALPKRREEIRLTELDVWDNELKGMNEYFVKPPRSLSDSDIGAYLRQHQTRYGSRLNRLVIKEFPTGELTVRTLEAYLDMLEAQGRFVPDLLLVDYADLMFTSAESYRLDLGMISKGLRGIAVKRNIAIATASQSNRAGVAKKRVGEDNVAEDFSKVGTADDIITYSQTDAEHKHGLARLFVAKARGDRARQTVLITQSYATGQFALSDTLMPDSYWSELERYDGQADSS